MAAPIHMNASRPLTIDIVLPTRGMHRRAGMIRAVESILERADDASRVRVLIGLDDDEEVTPDGLDDDRVVRIVAAREDTLGAKLNRLNAHSEADVRVYFADDITMGTAGWDTVLSDSVKLFPDRLAILSLTVAEQPDALFTHMPVLTKQVCDLLDGFAPHVFPFWWWDTWLDEIGEMTGRKLRVPVEVVSSRPGEDWRGKTMGLRDVAFWARVFDESRDSRVLGAIAMLARINDDAHTAMMMQRLPWICAQLGERNANLRHPDEAAYFERRMTEAGGIEDARYLAVKARALEFMKAKAAA